MTVTDPGEIRARDAGMGAFVEVADDIRPMPPGSGPLAGLGLAVKDMIEVAGRPLTCGLPRYRDRRARTTAAGVARLLEARAPIGGMTTTDSAGFATTTPAVTHPFRPGLSVGGSSGGSAAAVAAGLADIGLGTDTGGSVRIPAANCALFSFKPTYGRVPLEGVVPFAESFDHPGVMVRDLDTLDRAGRALLMLGAGPTPAVWPTRIGVDRGRFAAYADPIRRGFEALLDRLGAQGFGIVDVDLGPREPLIEAHGILASMEGLEVHGEAWRRDPSGFTGIVDRTLAWAERVPAGQIALARRVIEEGRRIVSAALGSVDLVIVPTLPAQPVPRTAARLEHLGREVSVTELNICENVPFNVAGNPVVVVPATSLPPLPCGVPLSVQLAAVAGADELLLALVASLGPIIAPEVPDRTGGREGQGPAATVA